MVVGPGVLIVGDDGCDEERGIASDHHFGLGVDQAAQLAGSGQFFDECVGDAGRIGGHVFLSVHAHAQKLASAGLVLVALDFTVQRCPAWLSLTLVQLAHHQALHLDQAGAFFPMGGHLERDGAAHPGSDAAGHFGVPDKAR